MLSFAKDGVKQYYHTDHLGSIRKLTNSNGRVTESSTYEAFGKEKSGGTATRYSFTGREDESDFGLMYYRARYYDPSIGRFISPDPFTRGPDDPRVSYSNNWYSKIHGEATLYAEWLNPHNFNRYLYCNNNPINAVDPLGLYSEDVHFYLTKFLAENAGFNSAESQVIAATDQGVDTNPDTEPFASEDARAKWHFPSEARVKELGNNAFNSGRLDSFGQFLHVLQDSYSHQKGKSNKNGEKYDAKKGHILDGHDPDITSLRPDLAYKMAANTYSQMVAFQKSRGMKVKNDWMKIGMKVKRFIYAKTIEDKKRTLRGK